MSQHHSYTGRLEVQSDGVAGSAGYVELTMIGDAQLDSSRSSVAVPRRGTEFRTKLTGQAELSITAQMTWDDADAVVAVVEAAHFANSVIGVKFLDKTAGTGLTADFKVESYVHDQSEDGVQVVNITLVATFVATDPAWA